MRFSDDMRVLRFRAHYKDLLVDKLDSKSKKFIKDKLSSVDVGKNILVISPNDWMRPVFASLFMRRGFCSYELMSGYRLLDIYLGNVEDMTSVSDIEADVLCLYLGYGEFENRRQVDIIEQVVNERSIAGKTVWLFCKFSNKDKVDTKYPGLVSLFQRTGSVVESGGYRTVSEEL